ncbi:UNVERIFIED_CONTAM: hypothetical protein K2H54_012564, partial [Gekko kuhli]
MRFYSSSSPHATYTATPIRTTTHHQHSHINNVCQLRRAPQAKVLPVPGRHVQEL